MMRTFLQMMMNFITKLTSRSQKAEKIGTPTTPTTKPTIQEIIDVAEPILREEEGYRTKVYRDTEGFLTVGIGHKVLPQDNLSHGEVITDLRVKQLFEKDVKTAMAAALAQAEQLKIDDVHFIARLVSVNFQLGTNWNLIHKNTWKLLSRGMYAEAAEEVKDSLWYAQTPNRVNEFAKDILRLIK